MEKARVQASPIKTALVPGQQKTVVKAQGRQKAKNRSVISQTIVVPSQQESVLIKQMEKAGIEVSLREESTARDCCGQKRSPMDNEVVPRQQKTVVVAQVVEFNLQLPSTVDIKGPSQQEDVVVPDRHMQTEPGMSPAIGKNNQSANKSNST